MASHDSGLADELELLRAVWPSDDELEVWCADPALGASLKAYLTPLTAGEDEAQFVRCELLIDVPSEYPTTPPSLSLGGSRGMNDHVRGKLLSDLESFVKNLAGEAVLYALLEAGREALTGLNAPGGECAICLAGFEEADDVLRTPCFHTFHTRCFADFWLSEHNKQSASSGLMSADSLRTEVSCPECRSAVSSVDVPQLLALYPALSEAVREEESENGLGIQQDQQSKELPDGCNHNGYESMNRSPVSEKKKKKKEKTSVEVKPCKGPCEEAFVRLHHLQQSSDPKERPLLKLIKEMGMDAMIFYGRPAMLHIQGAAKDVDTFVSICKRRHITISIQLAQRSQGPPLAEGVTAVPASKGSLDSDTFANHLSKRGLGESSYTILNSN